MKTPAMHQKKVAKDTLCMSIPGARVMGGMTHAQAYQIIFNKSLPERMRELMSEYPNAGPNEVNTELDFYGWHGYADWQELLKSCA